MQERWLLKPTAKTFGLGVLERTRDDGKRFVLYTLPDVVMIVPITREGTIIRVQEPANQPQKLGKQYHNFPGETFELSEQGKYNELREKLDGAPGLESADTIRRQITDLVCDVGRRGLLEEIGTRADHLEYIGNILENTGRSKRLIHFVLAHGCKRVQENECGISSTEITPKDFWFSLAFYLKTNPTDPHGGANTLKAFVLAANWLGWWPQVLG